MIQGGLPQKQGLYDPRLEHDACGIGFIADIKGRKSHNIVRQALNILVNLAHRGGSGAEANTGDGAGILIQLPVSFFDKVSEIEGFKLPVEGGYGVGMVFLPQEDEIRRDCEEILEAIIKDEGQILLGWRTVPTFDYLLGDSAKASMPCIRQVFIGRGKGIDDDLSFERKLYLIRRLAEKEIRYSGLLDDNTFYFASLSCRTIVYKGMLTANQVEVFYPELLDQSVESALALVHSRFSTNTFPSWERAHPNRYLIHNGEINTLQGNINWMNARQAVLNGSLFKDDLEKLLPVINEDGSDSAMFDNCLEFLLLSGYSLPHAVMMMVPEPYANNRNMSDEKKAFYEYHACLMESWDGPAAMAFTDGSTIAASLDRNGLRPSRYYITTDDQIILASEAGVLDIPEEKILVKERLHPGMMLVIDTKAGRIISDSELKHSIAREKPYKEWLKENLTTLEALTERLCLPETEHLDLVTRQKAFGYSYEDLLKIIAPMALEATDPVGSMGTDVPLAVLSDKPQLLYNYFKQLFAQVTNPPIDAIREEIVTSTDMFLGSEGSLVNPEPANCRRIKIKYPVIDNRELAKIRQVELPGFKAETLPILFKVNKDASGKEIKPTGNELKAALENLFDAADKAVAGGTNILILSDKGTSAGYVAIPALLAVSGLHHHLIKKGTRTLASIVLESGEPREVHHFSTLIGYGVSAVNPYLVFETIENLINSGIITNISLKKAVKNYIKASVKGIVKVLSKMGISTMQSYHGAQIFEALGISSEVIDKYFTRTFSRIQGIGLDIIEKETIMRHDSAFSDNKQDLLDSGGVYQWRKDGEYHMYNPETIHKLQYSCRNRDYKAFRDYSVLLDNETQRLCTIRGLLDFKDENPISIDEVEPVDAIVRRFKTGAMSYGSISREAHETIAIAMNRLGGKSNTGEGGEDPERFFPLENGDNKRSAIKQVASGRFGVNINYLVNADELQIKMAQGAKPGEGGQLPGKKVYPWIAGVRGTTPGVGLISPPPHHDIYSIEDLAELIHDLKNANRKARISVKLVSEVGVGTIAAGVAKSRADVVLISGYDGGTGAAPRTSIKHAGLPWELGLAETHQTLIINDLRGRISVETDGKLMTGRDVAIAALLGADEFGFATAPLVVLGCVMMRVCNLDTCPVGIATQNPKLRNRFKGKPEHLENFMRFIAQELREYMAKLGFKTVDEMIGRTDKLEVSRAKEHWKAGGLDLSALLYKPETGKGTKTCKCEEQDHEIEKSLDMTKILELCRPAIEKGEKVNIKLPLRNTNRATGTVTGSEIAKKYGLAALPEDTICIGFKGSAGQSFGAFIPKGMTLTLEGDANDYTGKGLSGGKLIVFPPEKALFEAESNILLGNVALFGATAGEAYFRGVAGERFCVRNSGAYAVVEGIGDHGCEYMTGGCVVVLGKTGRNFGAGMSGGTAYVLDEDGCFEDNCNHEMVLPERISEEEDKVQLLQMLEKHALYTKSKTAEKILADLENYLPKFIKVIPRDYKRMLNTIKKITSEGIYGDQALMAAFEENYKDLARAGGN